MDDDDADIIWMSKKFNYNLITQYLRLRKAATPALTHSLTGYFEGIFMFITKLVEWPVVESVPALLTTLYNGHE